MSIQPKALLAAIATLALLIAWPLWVNASFYFIDPALQIMDFASNDILVVEAKKLSLLHGHYSRAGFYHPGPFYFYWMAGWETLLLDWLPAFSSPAAAQHFSATALMAAAFGSFAFLTTRLSGNILAGLAATAALFALVYVAAGNVITAPWTPHMLVASSIFTLTACIGLLQYGWGWLPLLVFGALQLLHGHASFFGLMPLIVLPPLLLALKRHGLPPRPWHTPASWLASAITLVMMAPLAVITLFNFPEPWASYLHQAGGDQHLAPDAAIRLIVGFMPVLSAGIPLLFVDRLFVNKLFAKKVADTNTTVDAGIVSLRVAACMVVASGCVAASLFAFRGIDNSEHRYLLFWFAPFVALPGALAVIACHHRVHRIAGTLLCVVIITASAITSHKMLPWMLHNGAQYTQYQQVWQRLQQLGQQQPLQIHTDNRTRFADIWSQLLTFTALGNRTKPAFCIAQDSWHLSYHAQSRCPHTGDNVTLHILMTAENPDSAENTLTELEGIFYVRKINLPPPANIK